VDTRLLNGETDMAKKPTRYTVSDGRLVLTLELAEEGGYTVTSPLDPGLVTEAATLEEAFAMARDAAAALRAARRKLHHGRVTRTEGSRGTAS
jgi:predicted RNase H-like HicB family nuclease